MGPDRLTIAARLREIAAYLRLVENEPYRARAYESGAASLEALGERFAELLRDNRLTDVPGIGPSLAAAISALAETGTTPTLDRLRSELPPGLLELADLPGLTPPRLRLLHAVLNIESRDDLQAALDAGRLREVKGFGPKTEAKLREALARAKEGPQPALLVDARAAARPLLAYLRGLTDVRRAELAGAIRRGEETVPGIELAIASVAPEATLAELRRWPAITTVEGEGPGWLAVRLAGGLSLSAVAVPPADFGPTWLRATGPAAHVQALEQRGAALAGEDEPQIYRALNLPFVPPELRDDVTVMAQAEAGDDFMDLVTRADLRGAVHCHTTHSDGRNTIEEMARAAEARGLEYMTITDHSPTAFYAGGVTIDRLHQQWEEIAQVQEKVKVRLLRGTESDITAEGALDYPDEVLERMDVVIASIHDRRKMTPAEMTERLVRAMRLPVFKIWGHALGRLLLRRPPIACDVEAVLDAAADSGRAAIEVNGDPNRLDLEPRWVRAARERGLRFVISADAHSTSDLDYLEHGVVIARRGGVRRSEVLNALDADAFRAAVRPG